MDGDGGGTLAARPARGRVNVAGWVNPYLYEQSATAAKYRGAGTVTMSAQMSVDFIAWKYNILPPIPAKIRYIITTGRGCTFPLHEFVKLL